MHTLIFSFTLHVQPQGSKVCHSDACEFLMVNKYHNTCNWWSCAISLCSALSSATNPPRPRPLTLPLLGLLWAPLSSWSKPRPAPPLSVPLLRHRGGNVLVPFDLSLTFSPVLLGVLALRTYNHRNYFPAKIFSRIRTFPNKYLYWSSS